MRRPRNKTGALPLRVLVYLLPHERLFITVRQHPALLIPSLTSALGGFLAAIALSAAPQIAMSAHVVVWILSAFLIFRFILGTFSWAVRYVAVTDIRFVLISGLFSTNVETIPIPNPTELTLDRSRAGRLLGYGAFTIKLDGKIHKIIDYIPYPDQIYQEIYRILSPSGVDDEEGEVTPS